MNPSLYKPLKRFHAVFDVYVGQGDVNGRDIIIVEDIVDSGLSVKYIEELFSGHKPKTMKVISLLVKPESLKYKVKIDYIGFNIPSKFVIGYGLDYAQKYRNLKSIYVLDE